MRLAVKLASAFSKTTKVHDVSMHQESVGTRVPSKIWWRHARVVPTDLSVQPSGSRPMASKLQASIISPAKLPMQLRHRYTAVYKSLVLVPNFRNLPDSFIWPNAEVTLFSTFSTGLLVCACSVVGAVASGEATTLLNLVTAILVIVGVVTFYIHELYRIIAFIWHHEAACWRSAEQPMNKVLRQGSNLAMASPANCPNQVVSNPV